MEKNKYEKLATLTANGTRTECRFSWFLFIKQFNLQIKKVWKLFVDFIYFCDCLPKGYLVIEDNEFKFKKLW